MPKTTVTRAEKQVTGSGGAEYDVEQYTTTIPKALAEAMGFEGGEKLDWKVEGRDRLSFKVVDD